MRPKPLWRCPECGAQFVTRNMSHSCGVFSLEALFARSDAPVLPLLREFAAFVRRCGPVTMVPQKSRVVFMQRVRFCAVYPRKDHFVAGIVLRREIVHPRVERIERYPPCYVHRVRIASAADLDAQLLEWLRESYRVYGEQRPLRHRHGTS